MEGIRVVHRKEKIKERDGEEGERAEHFIYLETIFIKGEET